MSYKVRNNVIIFERHIPNVMLSYYGLRRYKEKSITVDIDSDVYAAQTYKIYILLFKVEDELNRFIMENL